MTVYCYTSFTFSYLSRAVILAETLRQAHPEWQIWALIVDKPPRDFDQSRMLQKFDRIVYVDELGIKNFESWIRRHNVVEACTAVKGHMLCHLLELGAEKVVYLDPDIAVFHRLDGIVEKLDAASIVLTPHQVSPSNTEAAIRDNEISSLKHGTYNLGFVAVRNDENGNEFAKWWSERLYFACFEDVPNGIFTDQKWCDLVPAYFSGVFIERDPGYNVASWNVSARKISIVDGSITVNNSKLYFYHFTKINSAGDTMTDLYAGKNTECIEIWNWYKRRISSIPCPVSADWYYLTK